MVDARFDDPDTPPAGDESPLGPWDALRHMPYLLEQVEAALPPGAAPLCAEARAPEPDPGPLYDDLSDVLARFPEGRHARCFVCVQCLRCRLDGAVAGGDARALTWWHRDAFGEVLRPSARA